MSGTKQMVQIAKVVILQRSVGKGKSRKCSSETKAAERGQ